MVFFNCCKSASDDDENDPLDPSKVEMYQRKCPFHVESDGITFNNKPPPLEEFWIRTFHWISRVNLQWGGHRVWWNPFVSIPASILYIIDGMWCAVDKEYYIKRRALFGPNFVSVSSVVIAKFDAEAKAPDSIDARFLTIPQRRGFLLGSTIMNRSHLAHQKVDGQKKPISASPLHVSDGGATMDPLHPDGQPNHEQLRDWLIATLFSDEKMEAINRRQNDSTAAGILKEFGENAKGITEYDVLKPVVEHVMVQYLYYTIFDIVLTDEEHKLIYETFYEKLRYILYLFGPPWVFSGIFRPLLKIDLTIDNLNKSMKLLLDKSPVLKDAKEGPAGLTVESLISMMNMVVGIAAFQGTMQLTLKSCLQTPADVRETAKTDPKVMRAMILESARMDTPVNGSHCIVDDPDGFTTTIGGKKIKFPRGTALFTAMTLANTDEERFPNPYVFDAEREGLEDLVTSFHGIGLTKSNEASPRICPGREIALLFISQLVNAKSKAEEE